MHPEGLVGVLSTDPSPRADVFCTAAPRESIALLARAGGREEGADGTL